MKLFILLLFSLPAMAQKNTGNVARGNELYRNGEYPQAEAEYGKAAEKNSTDYKAVYNQGNAQYRQNNFKAAAGTFTKAADNSSSDADKARALYNKGTALAKEPDLPGAVAAFKAALKLNPDDEDCRYNLAKAIAELKKQQKSNPPPKQENKQQPAPPNKQPPPKPSKLSKTQLQQVLLAIRKKEKEVQQRLKDEKAPGIVQPDKDW